MAGLSLPVPGARISGSGRASAAVTLGGASGSNTGTVSQAAFGPAATTGPGGGSISALSPTTGQGLAFWGGVVAIGVLIFVRYTLPR
jgi:hypothetical protein